MPILYSACTCTVLAVLQWLYWYSILQWLYLYSNCTCTVFAFLQWLNLYSDCTCTVFAFLQWLYLYSDCTCTVLAFLQWLYWYSSWTCTALVLVQYLHFHSDCTCKVLAFLQWLYVYSDCTCTVFAFLQWLYLYSDCTCTVLVLVQCLHFYSDCIGTVLGLAQRLYVYSTCIFTVIVLVQFLYIVCIWISTQSCVRLMCAIFAFTPKIYWIIIKYYQWSTNWYDRWSWSRLFRIFGKHTQVTRRRTTIKCLSGNRNSNFAFRPLEKTADRCKGVYLHLLQMLYLYCLPCILNGVQYCYKSCTTLQPVHYRLVSHVKTGLSILHKIVQSIGQRLNSFP